MAAPVGQQLTVPEYGPQSDLLLVAGGTGLAPLRAVLEQIDRKWETTRSRPGPPVHGSRMPWNLYDNKHLNELARKPWFDFTPVVSEDRSYPGARGLVGTWPLGPVTGRGVRSSSAARPRWFCTPSESSRPWSVGIRDPREQFDFATTPQSLESTTWEAR